MHFQNPGTVTSAKDSRLSPLPPEPVDFNYGRGATIDIPIDSATVGSNLQFPIPNTTMKGAYLIVMLFDLGFEKERAGTPSKGS